jgi:hypothetical protein
MCQGHLAQWIAAMAKKFPPEFKRDVVTVARTRVRRVEPRKPQLCGATSDSCLRRRPPMARSATAERRPERQRE